eukprot:12643-Heterococcus_DN1.PRE.1
MLLQWLPCKLLLCLATATALRMLHQPQLQLQATSKGLILGLNKYSHDVSVCVLTVEGEYLFAAEKERLTRRKHDSGDACEVIEHALECIGARPEHVKLVVSNNHHCRVQPFEKRLPWTVATGQYPPSYTSEMNLLPEAKHIELSHHLAHVYGAVAQAPFDEGLVVCMDGMGESLSAMGKALADKETEYYHDLLLQQQQQQQDSVAPSSSSSSKKSIPFFKQVPKIFKPYTSYREAESAYLFNKDSSSSSNSDSKTVLNDVLQCVYKRWTQERSPPELYNHGFENMESLGAVYSRVSSNIFNDWNACGKVMGLAPWHTVWNSNDDSSNSNSDTNSSNSNDVDSADADKATISASSVWNAQPLMEGSLLNRDTDESNDDNTADVSSKHSKLQQPFKVNWDVIESLPHVNQLHDKRLRSYYASLAYQVQSDLETVAMDYVTQLRLKTGAKNLVLCGGVALNSVLNGRIMRDAGYDNVYITNHPG